MASKFANTSTAALVRGEQHGTGNHSNMVVMMFTSSVCTSSCACSLC